MNVHQQRRRDELAEAMIGQKFHGLTFIETTDERKWGKRLFKLRCDCGKTVKLLRARVVDGYQKSCGCRQSPQIINRKYWAEYKIWCSMRARCNNKNDPAYGYYGGRGISICERWKSFDSFTEDMGHRPPGGSIDRINNDGNYEPGNCRWADRFTQAQNQRIRKDNKTGVRGIHTRREGRKVYYQVAIQRKNKKVRIGFFKTLDSAKEALAAYLGTDEGREG